MWAGIISTKTRSGEGMWGNYGLLWGAMTKGALSAVVDKC